MSRARVSPPTWLQGYGIDDLAAGLAVLGVISQDWLHERYERRDSPFVSETDDLGLAAQGFSSRPRVISRPCFVLGLETELDADKRAIPVRLQLRTAGASLADGTDVPEVICHANLPKRVWSYGNAPKVAGFTEHSGVGGRCMDPLCDFDRAIEREHRGALYGSQATCRCRRGGFTFRMLPQTRT